ncbi:peptidylprolyl isomerase [Rickettsia endosymbiont of Cardiosporidium cionae]|uniref:peptidylprolyl isomerase n=1 Tax=Rickettsia endosymbiont of Cardiosporidium cionae TaxID=2777155 RepID=UPI001894731A|nr:peptidylprolyl isomerase [Rickettsia endosymbiont of Cardiosporidium cionae]KAF8818962.1 Foldase protein PrsA [Rickettsia endosymbiont of Cardiosporidium cionae]
MKTKIKNIKNTSIIVLIFACIALCIIANFNFTFAAKPETIATYNCKDGKTVNITLEDLLEGASRDEYKKYEKEWNAENNKSKQNLILNLVVYRKLQSEIQKSNLEKSDEFKKILDQAKKSILLEIFIKKTVENLVTNEMIETTYQDVVKSLRENRSTEVNLRQILVDTEAQAKEVVNKLKKGANFIELSKKYNSKKNQAENVNNIIETGYMQKGQFISNEYEKIAFILKKNEFSNPIKTDLGWYVIQMIDSRSVALPSEEQLREYAKDATNKKVADNYIKTITLEEESKIVFKF